VKYAGRGLRPRVHDDRDSAYGVVGGETAKTRGNWEG
jgi:hypothetical protein